MRKKIFPKFIPRFASEGFRSRRSLGEGAPTVRLGSFILFLVLIIGIVGIVYFKSSPSGKLGNTGNNLSNNVFGWKFPIAKFPSTGPGDQIAYSSIRDPGGIPRGLPVRLKIPVIGVDTSIEDALITPDGRMDVPQGTVNVAWFSLGPHPGRVGSAVIGGHFGIDNGIPKVFYNLNKLKIGDKVYILDDKGETLAFIVRSIDSFDRNADATTVFTSTDGLAHLNLITCEGVWNQINDTYPERLVVFTDAIPSEGAVVVKPKLPSTAIVAPTSPPSATATPIANSIGPENLTMYLKTLYATPIDGLITSLLLASIAFILFKKLRKK